MSEELKYDKRPLHEEMIGHCPTLDEIDCIGLVEIVLNHYGRTSTEQTKENNDE